MARRYSALTFFGSSERASELAVTVSLNWSCMSAVMYIPVSDVLRPGWYRPWSVCLSPGLEVMHQGMARVVRVDVKEHPYNL